MKPLASHCPVSASVSPSLTWAVRLDGRPRPSNDLGSPVSASGVREKDTAWSDISVGRGRATVGVAGPICSAEGGRRLSPGEGRPENPSPAHVTHPQSCRDADKRHRDGPCPYGPTVRARGVEGPWRQQSPRGPHASDESRGHPALFRVHTGGLPFPLLTRALCLLCALDRGQRGAADLSHHLPGPSPVPPASLYGPGHKSPVRRPL